MPEPHKETERIAVDGKVYRRAVVTGIEQADAPPGPQDPAPIDWFYAWIPEDRYGTEHPDAPIDHFQGRT